MGIISGVAERWLLARAIQVILCPAAGVLAIVLGSHRFFIYLMSSSDEPLFPETFLSAKDRGPAAIRERNVCSGTDDVSQMMALATHPQSLWRFGGNYFEAHDGRTCSTSSSHPAMPLCQATASLQKAIEDRSELGILLKNDNMSVTQIKGTIAYGCKRYVIW